MALRLFGHATSQPTRAVLHLMAIKQVPYEFVKTDPMSGFDRAFKDKFPSATIPALEDGELKIA